MKKNLKEAGSSIDIRKFQESMPPTEDEFYLLTHRFDKEGNTISKKVYKVFNIIKYPNLALENLKRILYLVNKKETKNLFRFFLYSIKYLNIKDIKIIPVLFSQDIELNKVDVYFTINY